MRGSFLILIWLIDLLIAAGIGYWCMVLFRGKGRSAGGGFALGFLLTFFFSIIGAVAAVLISYLIGPARSAYAQAPVAPQTPYAPQAPIAPQVPYTPQSPTPAQTPYAASPAAPQTPSDPGPGAPPAAPAAAPAVSAGAQTIATFGPSTGWNGKRIVYDQGYLQIEGVGVVGPADVLTYADAGQIDWASDAMRDYVKGLAGR